MGNLNFICLIGICQYVVFSTKYRGIVVRKLTTFNQASWERGYSSLVRRVITFGDFGTKYRGKHEVIGLLKLLEDHMGIVFGRVL
jgi:hypothetical protein